MKAFIRITAVIFALLIVLVSFASCGTGENYYENPDSYAKDKSGSAYEGDLLAVSDDNLELTSEQESLTDTVKTGRKIIENLTFHVQTKEYDSFIKLITAEVVKAGGYVESSNITGENLNYSNYSRSATFVIRIPIEKSAEFSDFVSENSTVTSKETTTDDVSLEYVDTESRIKALESEKEALEKMLSEADTVDNIISIRSQLSNVIYEIESAKSRLRTIDDLVEYSTITLTVNEVERPAVVEKQSRGEKMWSDFKTNCIDIYEGLLNFGAFLFSALPYLLLFGVISLIIFLIIFTSVRKKIKKKKAAAAAAFNSAEQPSDRQ